jgi:hypothetical protein
MVEFDIGSACRRFEESGRIKGSVQIEDPQFVAGFDPLLEKRGEESPGEFTDFLAIEGFGEYPVKACLPSVHEACGIPERFHDDPFPFLKSVQDFFLPVRDDAFGDLQTGSVGKTESKKFFLSVGPLRIGQPWKVFEAIEEETG